MINFILVKLEPNWAKGQTAEQSSNYKHGSQTDEDTANYAVGKLFTSIAT